MPAIAHRTVTVDGLHLFVRQAGNPDQPTIVLLPGYPSSTSAGRSDLDATRSGDLGFPLAAGRAEPSSLLA